MISYENLWVTMEKKGITKYQLNARYGLSRATIQRLVEGNLVTLYTINRLCEILNCEIQDIITYKNE